MDLKTGSTERPGIFNFFAARPFPYISGYLADQPLQGSASDKELLDLVASGDQAAFERLFNAWYEQLGAHIYRLTESRQLAEEIVQDVFLNVWINREALAGITNFRAYLFVASRNRALNALRSLARERTLRRAWQRDNGGEAIEPSSENSDLDGLLDLAVRQLPPQQQKVYVMSRYQRLRYDEIASRMNISRETVKKYLQHATASISAYIRDHLELMVLVLAFLKKK
ncbi:MAG: RNA polymerase sigma-70 factor [Bacteroidetes bacterium]|nr:RNA polymerase sigma-70 factor [Bacteroidota bacterium]